MTPNKIVHVEFAATDPIKGGQFYSELFGWPLKAWPEYNYATVHISEGLDGGFPQIDGKDYKPGDVVVYIETDDIEGTLQRIEAHGGKTLRPRTAINANSWYAFFADPSGNRVALFSGVNPASA